MRSSSADAYWRDACKPLSSPALATFAAIDSTRHWRATRNASTNSASGNSLQFIGPKGVPTVSAESSPDSIVKLGSCACLWSLFTPAETPYACAMVMFVRLPHRHPSATRNPHSRADKKPMRNRGFKCGQCSARVPVGAEAHTRSTTAFPLYPHSYPLLIPSPCLIPAPPAGASPVLHPACGV